MPGLALAALLLAALAALTLAQPAFIEPSLCAALGLPGSLDECGLCVLPGQVRC